MSNLDETIGGFESSDRHPLEMLADEFSTALRDGSNPSIAEFADRVPEMREQALALLQSIVMFEQVSQQEDSRHRLDRSTNRFKSRNLEVLGDFKILREIGRGGMGIIYEAEQLSLKRRVALKVLGPSVADSAKQLDRFRRESEAIARLHHTNIVPVFGVGTEEGVHYFAMQLIEGKPLSTPPDLSFQEIARIGMQAASALAYAHEHGVLHRDIKPSNLLLDVKGELWVTDFGLAKLTDSSELTQDGDIMGTLKYMAPEQLDGRSDARTDIYSLGLTLYELTTHQPAFDTSKSLAERIRNYEIVKPRTINPAIPRSLETIILKATARDAHARYQSALEMGEDLRCFIDDRPIAARRASAAERLGRWVRRNPALAGSLALTLLVLIATSIVSGLGYWTTQQALGEAERAGKAAVLARDAADKSRAQAEANLNVATTAFDAIFDNVAKRGVPQALALNVSPLEDDDATANSVQLDAPHFESRLTTADTELLANLLNFYREFAKQNTEDRELQTRIARAYRRSGQIQQRLGEIDEAIASYDVALTMLVELVQSNPANTSGLLAIAQILNDRGVAAFANTEFFPDIVEHHHRAAALLKSQPDTVTSMPEVRFEIARSLDLAGSLIARRGVTNADLADVDRTEGENNMRGRGMPRGFGLPFFDNKRRQMEFRDREHPLPPAIDKLFSNIAPPNASRDGEFAFRLAPPPGNPPPRDPPPGNAPDGRFDERGRNHGPDRMPGRGGPGGGPG
ncbi:MAG: serine/threonine-protein kinase, partial [Pirellulaceae bacterium]|nr:serine/threonine-protein kinase [Pirellulaceae bacterium]